MSGGKKGKPKVVKPAPYRDYKLPTAGEVICWQEFFGTLVATVYNQSDVAAFKIVMNHSSYTRRPRSKSSARPRSAR